MLSFSHFAALLDRGLVQSPNTSEARLAESGDGRVWVYKAARCIGDEGLLAEAIAWQLAAAVRLPVPEGAFGELEGHGRGWLSSFVRDATDFQADLDVENIGEVGGVLALDAVVCNEDRHADNLLVAVQSDGRLMVAAIDWDRSAVSRPGRYRAYGTAGVLDTAAVVIGLHFDQLLPRAMEVATQLHALPNEDVAARVAEANRLVGMPANHVEDCAGLLSARLAAAPTAVRQYFAQLARSAAS